MKKQYLSNVPVSFQKLKRASMTIFLALFVFTVHAQVGIGTTAPEASAQLEVKSTTKGILIPRMLDTERTGIASPVDGLLVYQTNGAAGFYYFDGIAWQPLKSAGAGTIIPFASGSYFILTTLANGLAEDVVTLGFGKSVSSQLEPSGQFDDTYRGNYAFSAPRNGTVKSISGYFSVDGLPLNLVGTTISITAQLFVAPEGSHLFSPTAAAVTLAPAFTGVVPATTISSGTATGLNVPVVAGDRLLLVFSASTSGVNLANFVNGLISAGIEIK